MYLTEIEGPEGTVYAKGIFKLKIQIPDRYFFPFFSLFNNLIYAVDEIEIIACNDA